MRRSTEHAAPEHLWVVGTPDGDLCEEEVGGVWLVGGVEEVKDTQKTCAGGPPGLARARGLGMGEQESRQGGKLGNGFEALAEQAEGYM